MYSSLWTYSRSVDTGKLPRHAIIAGEYGLRGYGICLVSFAALSWSYVALLM